MKKISCFTKAFIFEKPKAINIIKAPQKLLIIINNGMLSDGNRIISDVKEPKAEPANMRDVFIFWWVRMQTARSKKYII